MKKRFCRSRQLIYEFADGKRDQFQPSNTHSEGNWENQRGQPVQESQSRRIVVVDDDALIRTVFAKVLKISGYIVLATLADGNELVSSLNEMEPKPEVIILDERMPGMSGVEACKEIHSKYPFISVIFVSADETAKTRAKQAGARIFLAKPVVLSDLISAINSV